MTEKTKEPAGTTTTDAAADAANKAALAQAQAEGRTAERARVSGIQSCEEAKGRTELANHLAYNTEMSVDEAKAILKAAPVAAAATATPANPFKAAMDADKHPEVTAEGGATGGTTEMSAAEQILHAQSKATGLKLVSNK